jgi:ubiquinone/menaquinone biosynthesis C-methylase UbiE
VSDKHTQPRTGLSGNVSAHYGRPGLRELIEAALEAVGKGGDAHLTTDDLAAFDQFHTGGKASTLQLADLANIAPDWRVLDVGGGLGGPARVLAETRGCQVTVLDLTPEFCQVGAWLTERAWLQDHVQFEVGNALAMPFPDATYDAAWTQHSSMNIADKAALYQEIARVISPGGRLALHEIMAGPGGEVHFPVPWAADPSISHLWPAAELRSLLQTLGFQERTWNDTSADALAWFRARVAAAQSARSSPPLGLHLLLGERASQMVGNLLHNLEDQRVVTIQAVFDRP